MSRKKPRVDASLFQERDGNWAVRITLPDGHRIMARLGQTQKIVYDNPQRVPVHLKQKIVPQLMVQARARNLTGKNK